MSTTQPQRSLAELAAAQSAAQEKTPGVVLEALEPSASAVAGIAVPDQISIRTWLRLEKVGSPFAGKISDATDITLEDVAIALYIIASDPDEVRATIRAGDDALEDAAEEFVEELPVSQLTNLVQQLSDYIGRQFATAAKMVAPDDGDGGKGGEPPLTSTSAPATAPEASQP